MSMQREDSLRRSAAMKRLNLKAALNPSSRANSVQKAEKQVPQSVYIIWVAPDDRLYHQLVTYLGHQMRHISGKKELRDNSNI